MRRPTLRTRDLLVIVLLIALFLAWNLRRERLAGFAESHRMFQSYCEDLLARRSWWSRDLYRDLHARQGTDHDGAGYQCLVCLDKLGPAHKRAAEAYQASAWFPWKSIPEDLIVLPEPDPAPLKLLPVPEDQ